MSSYSMKQWSPFCLCTSQMSWGQRKSVQGQTEYSEESHWTWVWDAELEIWQLLWSLPVLIPCHSGVYVFSAPAKSVVFRHWRLCTSENKWMCLNFFLIIMTEHEKYLVASGGVEVKDVEQCCITHRTALTTRESWPQILLALCLPSLF